MIIGGEEQRRSVDVNLALSNLAAIHVGDLPETS